MADSILRLKVESQEYDNKLKQAAQGLTRYADECRKVGGTLEVVEKDTLDYVRAIGQMDTTSRTATGKLAEMKKTFVELSAQYKQMTDAEKNSPFGKALATSLDQLKGRITESKAELDDINKSINGGGGISGALDNLAGKFGMNVQSLASWGTALAAGKAALDVAKDAFFASESTVDEWGRVMDSSKSLYEGFLTALNTGDISGYLSRIDSIVQAARAAYDELDRLGTMKTIQAPQMSAQQTENERMRMMIQTGRYIAPVDGRRASMQNGQLLTPDQIKRIEQQLQGGMQKVVTLVGNEVAQTGRAIDAVYNRQAQELGMSLKEFRKGTSSMAEFDKRMAGYDQYQKWRAEHTTIDMQSGREIVARGNPFEQFAKWGTFRVDGQRYNDLVKLIQQRDQQAGQAYSMQSQAYRTMNRAEGVTLRQLMSGGSGGGGGRSGGGNTKTEPTYAADSIAAQQALVQQLTKQWNEAGADVRDQYLQPLVEAEAKLKEMQNTMALQKAQAEGKLNGVNLWQGDIDDITGGKMPQFAGGIPDLSKSLQLDNLPLAPLQQLNAELARLKELLELAPTTEAYQAGLQAIADKEKEIANFKGIDLSKDADKSAKSFQTAAAAIGQVGSAMSRIEDPTMKIMGIVAQAIATVAQGFATATTAESGKGVYAWIAAIAGGMATMYSTIESIHSATGYAQGGLIKGNSYSGDNIGGVVDGSQFVGLNAGEVVLNASQQSMLASNLQGGGGGKMEIVGVLSGENVVLMADRWGRRTGRGELLFGKNL